MAMSNQPRMATDIPASITIPDRVESRLGALTFTDGFPDDATVEKVFDNLDFQRAVQAFLTAMPAASIRAQRRAFLDFGPANQTILIFETLMDSRSLFLTANTESVYILAWIELSEGPVVVDAPPGMLGIVDDAWFHYVADIGLAGPDKGQGGRFVFVGPDHRDETPPGTAPTCFGPIPTATCSVFGDSWSTATRDRRCDPSKSICGSTRSRARRTGRR